MTPLQHSSTGVLNDPFSAWWSWARPPGLVGGDAMLQQPYRGYNRSATQRRRRWRAPACHLSLSAVQSLTIGVMAGIATMFEGTIDAIKKKLSGGEAPTPSIIGRILHDQANKAQGMLRKEAQPGVRGECITGFRSVGWDFDANRSTSSVPPSIDQVMNMLSSTASRVVSVAHEDQVSATPTEEELSDIALATDRLWQLDANRLHPENGDYALDLQCGKRWGEDGDVAARPLFAYVNHEFFRRPTFAAFLSLLDNYTSSTGTAEYVTADELRENRRFLDAVMATPVGKYMHKYLCARNLAPRDEAAFKEELNDIWFQTYERSRGVKDSSGFEHVFIGEVKNGKASGFHNWLRLYAEERAGRFNYQGFIRPRSRGGRSVDPLETEQLLSVNFTWSGVEKDSSTVLFGTSPEFEIALYTTCFLTGAERQLVKLGPYRAEITCHKYMSRGKEYVGSSYPGTAPLTQDQAATKIQSAFRGLQIRRVE